MRQIPEHWLACLTIGAAAGLLLAVIGVEVAAELFDGRLASW